MSKDTNALAPASGTEVVSNRTLVLTPGAPLSNDDAQAAALERLDDEIHRGVAQTLQDALHFAQITPDTAFPPDAWVAELGHEGAQRRLRLAKAAWKNAKESPVGLKLAKEMYVGSLRARAERSAAPKIAASFQIVLQPQQYPSKQVDP